LGIVTGLYITPGDLFLMLSGIVILVLFSISLFYNRQLTNHIYGFALTLALFICGLLLYTKEKNRISIIEREEALFTGILSDYPEEKDKSYRLILKLEKRITKKCQRSVNGSLMLYYRKDSVSPSFRPGDRMTIRCTPVEITSRGNPYEFDYRFYMETRGIRYIAFIDENDIFRYSAGEDISLKHRALMIRERIIEMFRERGIREERLALVAAITLGQKNMLDPEQKQHFMKAGIMHVMAVSGLHALILSMFVFRMLFFLKGRLNIVRVIITILLLWTFAFITGLSSSVLRASLMFSFLQAGKIMKRPVNGINSVLTSAFVLMLIRPSVIFDAGFQLSYAAVIYIICFYRDLYKKITFRQRLPDLIWQSAAVTIIAQAGTMPLTIMLFNRFPVWFILSNIVIVPVASLVIILGALVPLTFPFRFLSMIIVRMLDLTAGLTERLTEMVSSLPFSTIENIGITGTECILLTLSVFLFTRYILNRKSIPALLPFSALLLFVLAGTIKEVSYRRTNELIVYNSTGSSIVGVRTGNILNIYSDTCIVRQEVTRHSSALNLKLRENVLRENMFQLSAAGKKIMVTSLLNNSMLISNSPDVVILAGKRPVIEKNIQYKVPLDALVISSEVPAVPWNIDKINALRVHFVKKQGAFHMNL